MLVYAAVGWSPRVELSTARSMLERLACLAIAGPVRNTPTAAMAILLVLPSLDLYNYEECCYDLLLQIENFWALGTSLIS